MGYGIKVKVWGDYACFTRPEMKVERVSYDVITPSAARGILDAIYWKPSIRWVIDGIRVLNEINFDNVRRNEVEKKVVTPSKAAMEGQVVPALHLATQENHQQRATLLLRDVAYVIEAHFEMTGKAGSDDTKEKHYNIALRRLRRGQCYHRPYLGCREFPAFFSLIETDQVPDSFYSDHGKMDLGWMLNDIDFDNNRTAQFFRTEMIDGYITVPIRTGGKTD